MQDGYNLFFASIDAKIIFGQSITQFTQCRGQGESPALEMRYPPQKKGFDIDLEVQSKISIES